MIFDKHWFKQNQKKLLFLANAPLVKVWFRWILRIRKCDLSLSEKITQILPNNFSYGDRKISIFSQEFYKLYNRKTRIDLISKCLKARQFFVIQKTTHFTTHDKFGKRLYFAFRPFWLLLHAWDMVVNWLRLPQLNFGFDTATFYPAAGANSPVDGAVERSGVSESFSTIRAGAGTAAYPTNENVYINPEKTSGNFNKMTRGIFFFDTSSLDDAASISAATFSLYAITEYAQIGSIAMCLVSASIASDANISSTDYPITNFGSTEYMTRHSITTGSSPAAYRNWNLNSSGLSFISKTGLTRFGFLSSWDLDNSDGSAGSSGSSGMNVQTADYTGTDRDPKLVITYTVPPTQKNVSDSGAGSDSLTALLATIKPTGDTGAGVDSLKALLSSFKVSDVGAGADSFKALLARLSASDSGVGSDLMKALAVAFSRSDSGAASDIIKALLVRFTKSESGVGADLMKALLASFKVSESGSGADLVRALLASFKVSDIGKGQEGRLFPLLGYRFDEGSGALAADMSGNAIDLTLLNTPGWVSGIAGNAIDFGTSGSKQGRFSLVPAIKKTYTQFSISCWAKFYDTTYNVHRTIFTMGNTAENKILWFFLMDSDECGGGCQLRLGVGDSVARSYSAVNWIPVANQWYNIVLTYNAGSIKFFVDGVQVGATQSNPILSAVLAGVSDTIGYVGISNGSSNPARAIIDEFRFFDFELSSDNISYLKSNPPANGLSITNRFSQSDSGVGSDLMKAILARIIMNDLGSGSDTIRSLIVSFIRSDSGLGSEAIAILATLATLPDSGVAVDAVSILQQLFTNDSGVGSDEMTAILAQLSISDSGVSAEALAILAIMICQDSGSGIDLTAILATMSLSEAGAGSDLISILAQLAAYDSGVAVEAIGLLAAMVLQEAGAGSDDAIFRAFVNLSDSGLAVEAATILANLIVNDAGHATDALKAILAEIQLNDSALGADVIEILKKFYPYAKKVSPYNKLAKKII